MRDTILPYGHQLITDDDIVAVSEALRSDYITCGSKVQEFENKVAEYCGSKYAVAVSSGTAALHCACYAVGISDGDEVITTPITFFATVASIIMCGGTPVFADVRDDTLNIDPHQIIRQINSKTKAIIPVDFAGHPVNIDMINSIAKHKNLIIIEDACHALGAKYKSKRIGGLSDMTVFSLHPVKSITSGEGGIILTNNKDYYDKMCQFRNHNIIKGKSHWQYEIKEFGFNYRFTDFQCALGISQLNKLDSFIKRRRAIAKTYNEAFADIDEIIRPTEIKSVKSAYHLYVIQLRILDREKIIQKLLDNKIGAQVHYIPCHLQPVMQKYGYGTGDFPIAEAYFKRCLSLPIFPAMSGDDVQYVIETVRKVVKSE